MCSASEALARCTKLVFVFSLRSSRSAQKALVRLFVSTQEVVVIRERAMGLVKGRFSFRKRREVVVDSNVSQTINIISHHDFSEGLRSWHANCCHVYVASKESSLLDGPNGVVAYSGESYIVITNRTECWQGLEQDITGKLSFDTKYDVSVFVRVHGNLQGSCGVQATLRLENSDSDSSYLCAGSHQRKLGEAGRIFYIDKLAKSCHLLFGRTYSWSRHTYKLCNYFANQL
ncbi:endo-1,4-beta-xylanase 1-like isoform X3 [Dendrobium catenatum]|uniref:endo-1,4-beta-xylanase 1-like isoform X3 n=1 Tax=Dendrobium catenatum TaxID=906689 RepID=UPI0009F4A0E5|nr:endo-1,4-beta-xylanase 1-like isoform X3 [Dendrobium catenatum]XP_020701738.1 endo-1,4-beta-xylanase 1-like isoform X3 [Dendrobium catenatum]